MRPITLALLLLAAPAARADDPAKIVFVAGSNFFKPGEHDYPAACHLLADLLRQTKHVEPVVLVDWPKEETAFDGASAIVLFMDGGAKHPLAVGDRMKAMEARAAKGVGIVQLHQIADYPKDYGDRARLLVGGAFETGYSARAHWVDEFRDFPKHDVFKGVTPFKIDDGWLTKTKFADKMEGVTPLLSTHDPKKKAGEKPEHDVVAWAFERQAGRETSPYRAFTFTGGHLHASFAEEGYRRFLVNAILWAAKQPIPDGGAPVVLTKDDLGKHLRKAPEKK